MKPRTSNHFFRRYYGLESEEPEEPEDDQGDDYDEDEDEGYYEIDEDEEEEYDERRAAYEEELEYRHDLAFEGVTGYEGLDGYNKPASPRTRTSGSSPLAPRKTVEKPKESNSHQHLTPNLTLEEPKKRNFWQHDERWNQQPGESDAAFTARYMRAEAHLLRDERVAGAFERAERIVALLEADVSVEQKKQAVERWWKWLIYLGRPDQPIFPGAKVRHYGCPPSDFKSFREVKRHPAWQRYQAELAAAKEDRRKPRDRREEQQQRRAKQWLNHLLIYEEIDIRELTGPKATQRDKRLAVLGMTVDEFYEEFDEAAGWMRAFRRKSSCWDNHSPSEQREAVKRLRVLSMTKESYLEYWRHRAKAKSEN